jgi:GTP cyclohydrolase II
MNVTETILGEFRKREAEIKKEGEERDKVAAAQLKESEKKLKGIRAELDAARLNYASMVVDYMTTETTEAAKTAARLKESELTVEAMKAGRGTMREYLERGLSDDALQKKAAGEAASKLTAGMAVIRDQSRAIIILEKAEADELKKIYYAQASPAQNQILKLRAEIETLNHGVGIVLESSPLAAYQSDEKRDALARANGKFIAGKTWEDLDLEGLRRLRFDCEIADRFLPDLDRIISEVKPMERVNVHLLSGPYTGGQPRLDYSHVRAEGVPITSTSIGMHK